MAIEPSHPRVVIEGQRIVRVVGMQHALCGQLEPHPRFRATRIRKPPRLRRAGASQAARSAQVNRRASGGNAKTREGGGATRTPRTPTSPGAGGRDPRGGGRGTEGGGTAVFV